MLLGPDFDLLGVFCVWCFCLWCVSCRVGRALSCLPEGTGNSLVATYFVSAFWHGFYPGYYLFFM